MILEIDAGNSSVKWRLLPAGFNALGQSGPGSSPEVRRQAHREFAPDQLFEQHSISEIRLSNVAGRQLAEQLEALAQRHAVLLHQARVCDRMAGLRLAYAELPRFGVDRWLGLLAALGHMRADSLGAFAVVDFGSAVNADLVDAQQRHLGGYLAPGVQMMRRALVADTQGIEVIQSASEQLRPGVSTESCIEAGTHWLLMGLVEQLAYRLASLDPHQGRLFFTGGDAPAVLEQIRLLVAGSDQLAMPATAKLVEQGRLCLEPALVLDGLSYLFGVLAD